MLRFARALLPLLLVLALIPPATTSAAEARNFTLDVPYRSQFDGSLYAGSNCGPTSIGMVLEAFGRDVPTEQLRDKANDLLGIYDPDDGTRAEDLAAIVNGYGLATNGPDDAGQPRRWTVDEVRQEVLAGRPVVALTYYPLLPNHPYGPDLSHYIVIVGMVGDNFLYNDSATRNLGRGYGVQITAAELDAAMGAGSIPYNAFSVGPGPNDKALLQLAPRYYESPTGRFRAK